MADSAEIAHPSPASRLYRLLDVERRDVAVAIAYAVIVGLLSLVTPIAAQALVNTIAFGALLQPLVILTLVVLAVLGFAGIVRVLQTVVVEAMQERLFVRVAADLALRLPRVEEAAFDRARGPELVNRFFDVLTVQKSAASLLLEGLAVVLQTALGLIVLAFYHPLLLAFDVVLVIAVAFILFVLGRGAVATSIRESIAKYDVAAWLEELARHATTFKAGGALGLSARRADGLARRYISARRAHFRVLIRQVAGSLALQAVAAALLLGLGGWLVMQGQLTIGQLVAAELIVTAVTAGMAKLGKHLETTYDLVAAMDKLGHLIDLPCERRGGAAIPRREGGAAVALRALGFGYHDGRSVLEGADLEIRPGERIALIGKNGSGKSTIAEILFGLRRPGRGSVEIDGMDLREASLESLRTTVALVRGVEVFDGTIAENVTLGRSGIGPSEVREALLAVGLYDEVMALPEGTSTRLYDVGTPLSLGQSRRLMIARAIAGRPRLLLLDDALDAIDVEARGRVMATLLDRKAPWTLVALMHWEAWLEGFDRVVEISGGALAERRRAS